MLLASAVGRRFRQAAAGLVSFDERWSSPFLSKLGNLVITEISVLAGAGVTFETSNAVNIDVTHSVSILHSQECRFPAINNLQDILAATPKLCLI